MNARVAVLRQLISESSYPIDEASVAEAIIVRAMARRAIPDLAFRDPPSKPRVRSFAITPARGPFAWLAPIAARWTAA